MLTGSRVRIRGSILVMFLGISVLASCSSSEPPAPTPTALFASDEEAFAAAEATLVAYNNDVNAVDLSDPHTFEPVIGWTVGEFGVSTRESLSFLHAERLTKVGDQKLDSITPVSFDGESVRIDYCLDITEVEILDENGNSVVPPDRVNRLPIAAELRGGRTSTGLVLAAIPESTTLGC